MWLAIWPFGPIRTHMFHGVVTSWKLRVQSLTGLQKSLPRNRDDSPNRLDATVIRPTAIEPSEEGMTAGLNGYWYSLERLRNEVKFARKQVEAAAGGIGLLPDGRPKKPRLPAGEVIDARPLFQLDRLLTKAFELAEVEAWRETHNKLIREVHCSVDDLSSTGARARVFCLSLHRIASSALQECSRDSCKPCNTCTATLFYDILPSLGRDYLGPLLGLSKDEPVPTPPLIWNKPVRNRVLSAVEALVAMPWDDADDEDCFNSKKWEAFQGG